MSIARLTKQSSAKYAHLRDSVEEAQNRVLSIQRRIKGTEDQIRNNPASAGELEPEIARQRERLSPEQSRYIALSRVTTAIHTWLMHLSPNVELKDAPEEKHNVPKGQTCAAVVRGLRDEIDKLASARLSVSRALLPIHEIREQANAYVDALAEKGKPTLTMIGDKLSIVHNIEGYAADAVALLAWMDPDVMKDRLWLNVGHFMKQEYAKKLPTMPKAERMAKVAELDNRILALEREEEFFVCLAEDEGTTIPRREKANPAAILCVEVRHGAELRSPSASIPVARSA